MIANKILAFQEENRKTQVPWSKDVHLDLDNEGIQEKCIRNRGVFRSKILDQGLSKEKRRKTQRKQIAK